MSDETIYAGCHDCGHIEPRPAIAREDWRCCENCHNPISPELYQSYEDAADAIEATEEHRHSEGRCVICERHIR